MDDAPLRVLLVEDDELNLELLETVLEVEGFTVLQARDAQQGIRLAREQHPDVILMDVQLPEMDGLDATRLLKAEPATQDIPVIAVTAHVKKEDEQRARDAGCVMHLAKPVDTRALPHVIRRVVERVRVEEGR